MKFKFTVTSITQATISTKKIVTEIVVDKDDPEKKSTVTRDEFKNHPALEILLSPNKENGSVSQITLLLPRDEGKEFVVGDNYELKLAHV